MVYFLEWEVEDPLPFFDDCKSIVLGLIINIHYQTSLAGTYAYEHTDHMYWNHLPVISTQLLECPTVFCMVLVMLILECSAMY